MNIKVRINETESFKGVYHTNGPLVVLTEKPTNRERTIQGDEAVEFLERIHAYRKDKNLWSNEDVEDYANYFDSECADHFLEDNEDDYERGIV